MVAASPARLRISLLACALLSLCVAGRAFAFTVPANDGYVTDLTNTLSAQQKSGLDAKLDAYRTQTSNQIAVLIVQTLNGEDINQVGVQVGRAWGVGDKQKNNGILLLIALQDRAMAILTGYGLEGAVPDIVAKGIIDTDITPQFRQGKYFEGISAGIDALQKHIGGEYTADRYAQSDASSPFAFPIVFVFLAINVLAAILGRTRSWWLGGVLGGVAGVILTVLYGFWLSIPGLVILGLIFDFIVSRLPRGPGGFGGFGGWGGFGGGGGRGGFGGFGGGSFGGGGASGKW